MIGMATDKMIETQKEIAALTKGMKVGESIRYNGVGIQYVKPLEKGKKPFFRAMKGIEFCKESISYFGIACQVAVFLHNHR
jgi:hypothetical protein